MFIIFAIEWGNKLQPCTRNNQAGVNWPLRSRPATKQPNSTGNTWNLWQRLKRVHKIFKKMWLVESGIHRTTCVYDTPTTNLSTLKNENEEEKTLHIQLELRVKSVLNRTAGSLLRWRLQLRLALLPNIQVASYSCESIPGDSVDDHHNIHGVHGVSYHKFINFSVEYA